MQTTLERTAIKAAEDKKYRFLGHYTILNKEFLHETFEMLNRQAAYGVDKVSYYDYQKNIDENIVKLVDRLKRKGYRAKLVRRQYIPKLDGKKRPLGIPAVEDKLVQLGVARILSAIYEQDYYPCMYGYRPKRNARMALDDIQNTLKYGGYSYVVEADIKGYFDNLDHDWLMKMLELRVNDKPFLNLIRKWLKAGVLEKKGKVIKPQSGSPQGGIISPILANIYMHHVVVLWFEKVIKRKCKGKADLSVYADDFITVFTDKEDAKMFYETLPERLEKFNLEISQEKTKIIKFDKDDRDGNGTFEFLGFEFRRTISRRGYDWIKRSTAKKKYCNSLRTFKEWCKRNRSLPIKEFMETVRKKMVGYINYYGIPGNWDKLENYLWKASRIMYKWLNRRSQRKSYSRDQFERMLKYYGYPKTKVTFREVN